MKCVVSDARTGILNLSHLIKLMNLKPINKPFESHSEFGPKLYDLKMYKNDVYL